MEFQEKFKFLNLQVIKKKNAEELPEDEKSFLKLNVLDKTNTPCAFMVFDKNVMKKILSSSYTSLSELSIVFDLTYTNDIWRVKLVDVNE